MDGFIKYINGNLRRNRTNNGWKLLLELKDVSFDWVPLKDLEHTKPVELVEYYVANNIMVSDESAFSWWVRKNFPC